MWSTGMNLLLESDHQVAVKSLAPETECVGKWCSLLNIKNMYLYLLEVMGESAVRKKKSRKDKWST